MNVATRLLLQQMQQDISDLKESIARLEQLTAKKELASAVDVIPLEQLLKQKPKPGRTLSLPPKNG